MRAVWLHTGNPRALQNQRCSLPGGLARLNVASFVGLIDFVGLVHCLDHRILHCECVDLPACRVSSTPREREAWCKHGGWNTLCPSQTSRLQCSGCEAKAAIYSVNPTGSLPHTLRSFIHSQLFTKGRPWARHYCFKDWIWRERKDVVSSPKWFYYKGDMPAHQIILCA